MLEGSHVLVTGAGGFIGSHLVERLLTDNHKVRALAHYRGEGGLGWLDDVPNELRGNLSVVKGDVRDAGQMLDIVSGVDVVFNLAALIGIPYSFEAASSYLEVNAIGAYNLLEASRRQGIKAFIQTSTSEVYGTAEAVPMSERHRLHPQSPYAASKVASDAVALSFWHSFELPVTIVRPFNTFGPRQSTRAVIPTIVRQLLESKGPIQLGNLTTRRDFTYVSDTVAGFIKAAEQIGSAKGQTFNLGAGWDISITDLVSECSKVLGISSTLESARERLRPNSSEVERLLSDNSLAREVLGWNPVRSSKEAFPASIGETARWWQERLVTGVASTKPDYHR